MLLFDGAGVLISLAVWIFCIIDVITTPDDRVRNLPKALWLLIVILLLDLGSIAWLVAGHPWNGKGTGPVSDRPRARSGSTNPDDDEEFLAGLRARADEQRRRAQEAEAERRRREEEQPPSAG